MVLQNPPIIYTPMLFPLRKICSRCLPLSSFGFRNGDHIRPFFSNNGFDMRMIWDKKILPWRGCIVSRVLFYIFVKLILRASNVQTT